MKYVIAAAAMFALAACQPAAEEAPADPAPAAPADALSALQAQTLEMQPVWAAQRLVEYQTANNISPVCESGRVIRADALGVIPANIDPASIFGPYAGSTAFSIQCGERRTTVRPSPADHWLVVFTPGAPAATIVNCADGNTDRCGNSRTLPTVDAAPAPAPAAP